MLNLLLDPVTQDLIDDNSGGFVADETSATPVMLQLSIHYEEWWGGPDDGSRLAQLSRGHALETIDDEVRDEVTRALYPMISAGTLELRGVEFQLGNNGNYAVFTQILDSSAGNPTVEVVTSFGGF